MLGELERLRHIDELPASKQATLGARISKSSDPSAARTFVTELDDVGDVRFFLNQDRATQYKSVYLLRNKETLRLVDDSVTPQDLQTEQGECPRA